MASDVNPINGKYSLHHVYDNPVGSTDQISYPLPNLDITADTTIWRWKVRHGYNPSANNNWAVFVISDQAAQEMYPSGKANGYAVGVNYSGSDDFIKLWKVNDGSGSPLLDTDFNWEDRVGTDSSVAFKVVRFPDATWEIHIDTSTAFDDFVSLGMIKDSSYLLSQYYGIYYKYSKAQDQKLWVDDISVEGAFIVDTIPPFIDTVIVLSDRKGMVVFSERVPDTIALKVEKYCINQGLGIPSFIEAVDEKTFIFHCNQLFKDEVVHTLTALNIEDYSGNRSDTLYFDFFFRRVKAYDIIINEVMADPDPVVGLPEFEYVELYNRCAWPVSLAGWTLLTGTRSNTLPSLMMPPDSFLILCHDDAVNEFSAYGQAKGVLTSHTSLTNSGQAIELKDSSNTLISGLEYTRDWYKDKSKKDGGWSLERIDPDNTCGRINNWTASNSVNGGTPGAKNSVYAPNIDTIAPAIGAASILAPSLFHISFSELLIDSFALDSTHYFIKNLGSPDSIIFGDDEVWLFFQAEFQSAVPYTVYVYNMVDYCSNIRLQDSAQCMYYRAVPNDIVINEIMADPEPVVGLPEYEYVELFNTCGYPVDVSDWTLSAGSKTVFLPSCTLQPDSFLILCHYEATGELSAYGATAGIFSSHTMLTNSGQEIKVKDNRESIINSVSYSPHWHENDEKENGGWALERIHMDNRCRESVNWSSSRDASGGTPGRINSIYSTHIDTVAPRLAKVEIVNTHTLKITYSEAVDEIAALNRENYRIIPYVAIDTVYFENAYTILMETEKLKLNVNYTLIVSYSTDYCRNITETDSVSFLYRLPGPYELLITEIMADPDPVVRLPNAEYIEITNRCEYTVSLAGWKVTVGNTTKTLPSCNLGSDDYLIICDAGDTTLFNEYGKTLGISGFPPLPNVGQVVVLTNPLGSIIHAIPYSSTWYQSGYKSEGGWSLEMVDRNNPCGNGDNWKENNNTRGGTPGQENSVAENNPDMESPLLQRVAVMNDSTLIAFFSESLDSSSLIMKERFSVDHDIGNPAYVDPVEPEYTSVILHYASSFSRGVIYNLTASSEIADCAGNTMKDSQTARFSIPDSIAACEILINEVLFNPKFDGVDFVEIYNHSDKTFDLQNLAIASIEEESGAYTSITSLSDEGYLLFPGEYLVLTTNADIVKEQYYTSHPDAFIELPAMPAFNNDKGDVILLNEQFVAIDAFAYSEDMHYPLLANTEGVSLERIHFDEATNDASNWHSASETVGYGTPAYENSQHIEDVVSDDDIHIEPEVFSPDNDGYQDVLNIGYAFNAPGYTANIIVFDSRGRQVRRIANNDLLGTSGVYIWDGLDDDGNKAKIGIHIIYIEVFNTRGDVKKYKKVCVVGGRLD